MSEALPKGWNTTKLGNIFEFKYGKSLPARKRDNSGYPVYGSNGIIGYHSKPLIERESIIIGRKGSVGEVHCSKEPCSPIDTTYFIDELNDQPIDYWVLFLKYLELGQLNKATAIPGLNRNDAYDLKIAVPPLPEQKRITAKLDGLLAKVDACKARLDKVPEIIKRFRQSVLADAVSGKLTEDWREINNLGLNYSEKVRQIKPTAKVRRGVPENVRIPDIISRWKYPGSWIALPAAELLRKSIIYDLKDGNHGSNHPKKEDFSNTGLPFITAAQVSNFKIDYENAPKLSGAPLNKLRVGFAKENDVILTHKGTVGRVAICDRDCILTPQTTYYRIDFDLIDPNYLEIFLLSPKFQKQLDQIKSQTTRDFVPVTAQYSLFHLLPPIEEQREIISRVKSLFALADTLEQRFEKAILCVEKLTASILSKAFIGELVPQDPNDEPAEMLLKRIRAERGAMAASKKKGGRSPKKRSSRGKRPPSQKAEAKVEPEPAAPKPAKKSSAKATAATVKPRKLAPKSIEKRFEKADLLKAFRKAAFRRNDLDEDSLLRLAGHRLGVRRLSQRIRRELETAIPTALRRNIIARDGTGYYGATPTIHHYNDAELIKVLRSVIRKGYEYKREHLTAEAATYLGFDKVSDAFAEKMKTVFRLAIRRGQLYRNWIYVGKV